MKFLLQKNKEIVGEVVVLSETNCVFHLWKDLRNTQYTTLSELKKKYKLIKGK